MRIEQNNVLRMYENTQKNAKQGTAPVANGKDGAKTDRVSISREASQTAGALRAVQNDAAEIENAASPERISQLTQQVLQGTYHVPTEALAGAILNTVG